MSNLTHISSLVVTVKPSNVAQVSAEIATFKYAEVAMCDPHGKIVVALETKGEKPILDFLDMIQVMDGVVNASLVFHQVDEDTPTGTINSSSSLSKVGAHHG